MMSAERWREVSRLFHEAVEQPVQERAAFLDRACRDLAVREEVESLLAQDADGHTLFGVASAAPGRLGPGDVLSSYRIEKALGRGGMGTVFLAFDARLRRHVAIKLVEGAASGRTVTERLIHEARSAAALSHPNICTIYEVGETSGITFIAMEYVRGQSLRERLDSGALPLADVIELGLQAAGALAYAHDRQVVHRDFKAANVIVTEQQWLKVIDFGLARRRDAPRTDSTTMATVVPAGRAAGTPYAMAPEQVRGEAAERSADIWALGVLLYEMATGTIPFRGDTVPELFSVILRDEPAPMPDGTPQALRALVLRCLAKDQTRRPHAHEVAVALEGLRERPPLGAVRRGRRPRAAIAAGSALLVLTLLASIPLIDGLWTTPAERTPVRSFTSIAVLPLENLSGRADQEYFTAGMHEALIVRLGKLSGLQRVTARPSVLRYRTIDRPLGQVARELGVDALITGTVLAVGDKVRITAHLIDPATERQLWSDSRPERRAGAGWSSLVVGLDAAAPGAEAGPIYQFVSGPAPLRPAAPHDATLELSRCPCRAPFTELPARRSGERGWVLERRPVLSNRAALVSATREPDASRERPCRETHSGHGRFPGRSDRRST